MLQQNMSLLDCLKEFNTVETLLEFSCEHCETKCALEKQLSIKTLPAVLTIQLKRFDAVKQKKIAGKIAFPLNGLDISSLILDGQNDRRTDIQIDTDSGACVGGVGVVGGMTSTVSKSEEDDVEISVEVAKEHNPVLYDLSSVICHQGTLDTVCMNMRGSSSMSSLLVLLYIVVLLIYIIA